MRRPSAAAARRGARLATGRFDRQAPLAQPLCPAARKRAPRQETRVSMRLSQNGSGQA